MDLEERVAALEQQLAEIATALGPLRVALRYEAQRQASREAYQRHSVWLKDPH